MEIQVGNIQPIIANRPYNPWKRDILQDMGVVFMTNDWTFFDDIMVHEKGGMEITIPTCVPHPQF